MDKRKVLKTILFCAAVILAIATIVLFLYPLVKAFLIYQSGVTEQDAFNALVVPLILRFWLFSFLSGAAATLALRGAFAFIE